MTGSELIAAERQRQIDEEGWVENHDDDHEEGQLAQAGACYAIHAVYGEAELGKSIIGDVWPFDNEWWKPKDRLRDLVRAGALIAAEIDRLNRKEL
jgi:hypothetical protein